MNDNLHSLRLDELLNFECKVKAHIQADLRWQVQVIEMIFDMIVESRELPDRNEVITVKDALQLLKDYIENISR